MTDSPDHDPIVEGACHVLFVYDAGLSINLEEAERLIVPETKRDTLGSTRRVPQALEYYQAPLRVSQAAEPLELGEWRTASRVDTVLYEFGAVLVTYTLPWSGPLAGLLSLSDLLYGNATLLTDSRSSVERILDDIRPAVTKPSLAEAVEDYVIFEFGAVPGTVNVVQWVSSHADQLAQILRSERAGLSDQEVQDALSCRLSYGEHDATLVDWNAALIIDREADEVRRVLEFANVELLETRFLDHQLDRALDEAYEVLSRRRWSRLPTLRSSAHDLHKVARLQVDSAVLFEGIDNALKLLGDQYLARVYRAASQRFHLAEWDQTILRKLGTLESIYQKMADFQANRRMEILEWIIIILFAVSIAISLFPGLTGH